MQACNQELFGTGELSWNRHTSTKVSCMTYKRRVTQGNFLFQDPL